MSDDPILAQFKELVAATAARSAAETTAPAALICEMLLRELKPSFAHCLRLSAIPHLLELPILRVLVGEADDSLIEEYWGFLIHLAVTSFSGTGIVLHDSARNYLFALWLQEPGDEFRQVSAKLRGFFQQEWGARKEQQARELAAQQAVFHSIGAYQARGMREFEELARAHRALRRFSEVANLIHLVHEYDSILTEKSRGILAYHEGKLASDRNQWDDAIRLFEQVLANNSVVPELQMRSHIRLGLTHLSRHDWARAIACFEAGEAMIPQVQGGSVYLPLILQDLAVAYRESGDRDRSHRLLNESIRLADQDGNLECLASSWNCLGTLHRSYKEYDLAISAFEKSLAYLNSHGDRFGRAAVLNNLGGIYSDTAEWARSEAFYTESLNVSRDAADTIGQARTLTNLVPVYRNQNRIEEAIEAARWAAACFAELHDYKNAAAATLRLARVYRSVNRKPEAEHAYRDVESFFEKAGATQDQMTTEEERTSMVHVTRLPWWAWVAILFCVFVFLLVVVVIAVLSRES